MRRWALTADDPLSLCLAADARLTPPSYIDDQIWEVILEAGEPPALSVNTSYGLRARSLRLFPGFPWEGEVITQPSRFHQPPIVRLIFPNYLLLDFQPRPDLHVTAEYWVPDSRILVGRLMLENLSEEPGECRVQLYADLRPDEGGQAMRVETLDGVSCLAGRTGGLRPVVFMAGGALAARTAYPALEVRRTLNPGDRRPVIWAHSGFSRAEDGFLAARSAAARPLDAEVARLERLNESLVEIWTGDEGNDAVLWLSQVKALSAFVGPTRLLPAASIVTLRSPDHGYSARGDGRDYDGDWGGQPPLSAYLAARQVLPAAPDLAKGLLRNYLHSQGAEGEVDWQPGLGGQRRKMNCLPVLASLAWQIYQHTGDRPFLEEIFPRLLTFFDSWLKPERDRDLDGLPEWSNTLQSGMDEHPAYVPWEKWSQGLDIRWAETTDLASYLYHEARSLLSMAALLGRPGEVEKVESAARRIKSALDGCWSEERGLYLDRDRETHHSRQGGILGEGRGEFVLPVGADLEPRGRLIIRSFGAEADARRARVLIRGQAESRRLRVEKLVAGDFHWFWDLGTATSRMAYQQVESVEVRGLGDDFHTQVRIADYSRETIWQLLPLWAGVTDRTRGDRLVKRALLDRKRFWRNHGLSAVAASDPAYRPNHRQGAGGVWMAWNLLLCEGLIENGYLQEAALLFARLMKCCGWALRAEKGFRRAYHCDRGQGIGDRHHLDGVAPVSVLLDLLGIKLLSPSRVWLRGFHPLKEPVRLRWRGFTICAHADGYQLEFANGETLSLPFGDPRLVERQAARP
jgi:hypothetical protein